MIYQIRHGKTKILKKKHKKEIKKKKKKVKKLVIVNWVPRAVILVDN